MIRPLLATIDKDVCKTTFPYDIYNCIVRDGDGRPVFDSLRDFIQIFANIIQLLMQLAGLLAVIMLIVGGIMYITSTGEPAKVSKAWTTILNAGIGLIITMSVFGLINLVAGKF